jgi:hypothetical protein
MYFRFEKSKNLMLFIVKNNDISTKSISVNFISQKLSVCSLLSFGQAFLNLALNLQSESIETLKLQ